MSSWYEEIFNERLVLMNKFCLFSNKYRIWQHCNIELRIESVYHRCKRERKAWRIFTVLFFELKRREVKHLLPITVLKLKSVRPQIWTTTVHEQIESSVEKLTPIEAKFKFISLNSIVDFLRFFK